MREHIRDMIDRVQSEDRNDPRIDARGQDDLSLRLASEAMRMAHMAVSVHMMLAARMRVDAETPSTAESTPSASFASSAPKSLVAQERSR